MLVERAKRDGFYCFAETIRYGIEEKMKRAPDYKSFEINVVASNEKLNELVKAMGFDQIGVRNFVWKYEGEFITENVYEFIL